MIPKILSSRLAAIQSSMDQGNFAYVLDTKLRATNNVVLLGTWRLQILSVSDVYSEHIDSI
jgi:hypothetical protein